MGARGGQVNVTHALAAHLGLCDFYTTLLANHTAVLQALVLAAQAFVVLDRTKNLGAKQAIGVDNDPQAILATVANSARNNLDRSIISACLPDKLPPITADVLMANILCAPLL